MEWLLKYGANCDPVRVMLMIVIFWLMKQNGALQREVFRSVANIGRLTTLLEGLVYGHRPTNHQADE